MRKLLKHLPSFPRKRESRRRSDLWWPIVVFSMLVLAMLAERITTPKPDPRIIIIEVKP